MNNLRPHFSLTRRAGGFVFVSGQLPFDESMRIVEGGIETQTRQCLDNLQAALITEGVGLTDIVKMMVWLANTDDFWVFNGAYAEYFPDTPPVRSTVGATLAVPGAKIEMEAMAWLGEDRN